MTVISVIVGSTREGRFSEKPAKWILQHLKKRKGVDARLLDLRDFPMPFFDQPLTPAMPGRPPYKNEVVQRWTAAIAQSDGFVFVTPEYNYGPSAIAAVHLCTTSFRDGPPRSRSSTSSSSSPPR